ncbi:MAG: GNAT family N-acetyltransferase [Bacillota bacterium]
MECRLTTFADLTAPERQALYDFVKSLGLSDQFSSLDEMTGLMETEYGKGRRHVSAWRARPDGGAPEPAGCLAAITAEAASQGYLYLTGLRLRLGDAGPLPGLVDAVLALPEVSGEPYRTIRLGLIPSRPDLETEAKEAGFRYLYKALEMRRPLGGQPPALPVGPRLDFRTVERGMVGELVAAHNAAFAGGFNSALLTDEGALEWLGDRLGTGLVQIGYAGGRHVCHFIMRVEDGLADLETIGVVPERRGQGLARQALVRAFETLRARGDVSSVMLTVIDANQPALGLYRRAGFEVTKERSVWYERQR